MLGAAPDASPEELRRAFVAQARRYHPDRHVGAEASVRRVAEQRMSEVTEAWSVLGDPQRRRHYDLGLGDPVARGGRGRAPSAAGGPRAGSAPPGGAAAGGAAGGSGAGGAAGGSGARTTGQADSRPATGQSSGQGRHWRHYASPGPGGGHRSTAEQVLMLSPALLVLIAGLFGMAGAIVGWPPFFAAALVCLVLAAAAFFMLPIWAMTRGRSQRGGRGPKRSY